MIMSMLPALTQMHCLIQDPNLPAILHAQEGSQTSASAQHETERRLADQRLRDLFRHDKEVSFPGQLDHLLSTCTLPRIGCMPSLCQAAVELWSGPCTTSVSKMQEQIQISLSGTLECSCVRCLPWRGKAGAAHHTISGPQARCCMSSDGAHHQQRGNSYAACQSG